MSLDPPVLLIGAVALIGVLHTMVPDHWMPIAVLARQRGWSPAETGRAALQAGSGHVLSTLALALLVWAVGSSFAARFGAVVDTVSSLALVAFGVGTAAAAWHERRHEHHHGHGHAVTPPARHRVSRTALLLILGSSPMIEGIPVFFAAGRYGGGLILAMSLVFAVATIATYMLLCLLSTAGLRRLRFASFERYGEVLSGGIIAGLGLGLWLWPMG